MADSLEDLTLSAERLLTMRGEIVRQVNEIFAQIADLAEGGADPKYDALVAFADNMRQERDELRETLEIVQNDCAKRVAATARETLVNAREATRHAATVRDAALTLRNALAGLVNQPLTDPRAATVIGQVNKALVEFDERTTGIVGV